VATDYQGLGVPGAHPYLATRPEAYSVLDSIRAAQSSSFGLSKKVVVVGQSQGGAAAFATAGYAPSYAPELDIRGTVATGVPYFSQEARAAMRAKRSRDAVDWKLG
jgi:pimeloyl-ACP methyl ester carboxylesterase